MNSTVQHFLVEITYQRPFSEIEPHVPAHRDFLQQGYDAGYFLYSGPQEPKVGGILLARFTSREAVEIYLRNDPYAIKNLATHRIVQFHPVKQQPFMTPWIEGKGVI